jgi:mannose-6-phosphate isomerase-like protein (cupin superfamily)
VSEPSLILTPDQALARLAASGGRSTGLVDKPIFDIRVYAPRGEDPQKPHARDEAYVIATGSGGFWCEGVVRPVKAGDLVYVDAGVEHRFVDFTDDFSTWVFFFGET